MSANMKALCFHPNQNLDLSNSFSPESSLVLRRVAKIPLCGKSASLPKQKSCCPQVCGWGETKQLSPATQGWPGGGQPMSSFALFTLRKPALEGEKSELPAR